MPSKGLTLWNERMTKVIACGRDKFCLVASHIFEDVPFEEEESDDLLGGETFPFFSTERHLDANLYLGWFRHHRWVLYVGLASYGLS